MSAAIRQAQSDEVEALVALQQEVHQLHLSQRPDQFKAPGPGEVAATFRSHLAASHVKVWVAELEGRLIGYAVGIHQNRAEHSLVPTRHWCEIDQLGVSADHRREGVARALLQAIVDDARAAGLQDVELSSWAFNSDAHAAFQACGFTPKVIRFELKRP